MTQRRQAQNAADAAALATAVALRDGVPDHAAGQPMVATMPKSRPARLRSTFLPSVAPHARQAGYAAVIVEQRVETYLVGAISAGDEQVEAPVEDATVADIEQAARLYALSVLEEPLAYAAPLR